MADEKPSGAWGNSIIVLAIAAISAAYVGWQQTPLVSSRPTEPEYPAHELRAKQDIDARLWEDPFAAVMRDVEAKRWADPAAAVMRDIAAKWRRDSRAGGAHAKVGFDQPGETTLVLGVTLPGASYPEVAETRRRLRYAVLSALHVARYTPADEKHIGYWQPGGEGSDEIAGQPQAGLFDRWPAATNIAASGKGFEADLGIGIASRLAAGAEQTATRDKPPLPPIVPWEEFDSGKNHILVLWLDEDFLTAGGQPINSLVRLRSSLNPPLNSSSNFALLGPEDSTMLTAMVHETRNGVHADFSVYNFGATAEEQPLLKQAGSNYQNIEEHFRKVGIRHYYRTVSTDDKLAKTLACELMRRDANLGLHFDEKNGLCAGPPTPNEPSNHIVLISDWDTVYGNDLSETVAKTLSGATNSQKIDLTWIRRVSYLRGLDGRLPEPLYPTKVTYPQSDNPEQASAPAVSALQGAATPETTSQFESAEGRSQFDYLRRLAADLKERDAEFHRKDGSHIGAIGVLGSDVYDKLLILQALRPALPEALFFTTDLDELLLPQQKARYTRNLLVASSFGLTLNDALQNDIPPFRNTYQTSIYLATHLAVQNELPNGPAPAAVSKLDDAAVHKVAYQALREPDDAACKPDADTPMAKRIACWLAEPRLFQIGRTTAKLLPQKELPQKDPKTEDSSCDVGNILQCRSIQPVTGQLYPELGLGALVSAASIMTIALLAFAFSIPPVRNLCVPAVAHQDGVTRSLNPRIGLLLGALAIAAVASCAFWWNWSSIAGYLTGYGSGEPMSLFEGISLWPSFLLRAAGAGLTLWLIFYTLRSLEDNLHETEREMSFPPSPVSLPEEWEVLRKEWDRIGANSTSYPTRASRVAALIWFDSMPRHDGGRPRLQFEGSSGFEGRRIARCIRALIATLLMFALGWILSLLLGNPNAPARGSVASEFFSRVTLIEVFLTLFLIFLVSDATLLSRAFIKRLTAVSTIWPSTTLGVFQRRFALEAANLTDWIDMQFLARRTRCITRIIYFPFIALGFLVFSRSELFDDFTMPWTIVIVQAISVAVVIGAAISLRLAAENGRTVACEHLNAQIIAAKGEEVSSGRAARLEKLLDEVNNLRDGAFAPWSSQPIVKAVLLPLITYGGAYLVHLYALPGI